MKNLGVERTEIKRCYTLYLVHFVYIFDFVYNCLIIEKNIFTQNDTFQELPSLILTKNFLMKGIRQLVSNVSSIRKYALKTQRHNEIFHMEYVPVVHKKNLGLI